MTAADARSSGELRAFLARDHERLDALLTKASAGDLDAYKQFRAGLLWHIGVEERILFPIVRTAVGESELIRQLHRDHAPLGALLMPPPNRADMERIREILDAHNPLEEKAEGFYDVAENVMKAREVMERVRAFPPVRVAPHVDTEITRWSIEQLVLEADEGRRRLG
ncbi:MAG TPA: hemerythrin domain-containing protein [Thermoanaerobaculia bacterium]|nr:hemerythrin domain-containing protein [Thermoanaerobaculia bacterium]